MECLPGRGGGDATGVADGGGPQGGEAGAKRRRRRRHLRASLSIYPLSRLAATGLFGLLQEQLCYANRDASGAVSDLVCCLLRLRCEEEEMVASHTHTLVESSSCACVCGCRAGPVVDVYWRFSAAQRTQHAMLKGERTWLFMQPPSPPMAN